MTIEIKPEVVRALVDFPAARGSRAKLFHLDGAHGGVESGESLYELRLRVSARSGALHGGATGRGGDAATNSCGRRRRLPNSSRLSQDKTSGP